MRVTQDKVFVRAAPDSRSDSLMQLERGAIVRLGDRTRTDSGGGWRHIMVGELQGWVPAQAVVPLRPDDVSAAPDTTAATAASAADTPEQQGRTLRPGAAEGVPPAPGRRITADAARNQAATDKPLRSYHVILNRLALRVAPDINADVVSHLRAGQQVRVLDQPPRRQWLAIEADGKRGWVSGEWLRPDIARD